MTNDHDITTIQSGESTTMTAAYALGHDLGAYMREQREAGDGSYDCRWDLADAAKQPGDYFQGYKQGLEDGLNGKQEATR